MGLTSLGLKVTYYRLQCTCVSKVKVKNGVNTLGESFDSCQPARTAQADMSRNFPPSLDFLHVKEKFHPLVQSIVGKMDMLCE